MEHMCYVFIVTQVQLNSTVSATNLLMRVTPVPLPFPYQYTDETISHKVLWVIGVVNEMIVFIGSVFIFRSLIRVISHLINRSMLLNHHKMVYQMFHILHHFGQILYI